MPEWHPVALCQNCLLFSCGLCRNSEGGWSSGWAHAALTLSCWPQQGGKSGPWGVRLKEMRSGSQRTYPRNHSSFLVSSVCSHVFFLFGPCSSAWLDVQSCFCFSFLLLLQSDNLVPCPCPNWAPAAGAVGGWWISAFHDVLLLPNWGQLLLEHQPGPKQLHADRLWRAAVGSGYGFKKQSLALHFYFYQKLVWVLGTPPFFQPYPNLWS